MKTGGAVDVVSAEVVRGYCAWIPVRTRELHGNPQEYAAAKAKRLQYSREPALRYVCLLRWNIWCASV